MVLHLTGTIFPKSLLLFLSLKGLVRDVNNKDFRQFRLLEDSGWSGMDLHAQKRCFQLISNEPDHRLSTQLPLSFENHWFSWISWSWNLKSGIGRFCIENPCFSSINPCWGTSERSWTPEIDRNVLQMSQKASGILELIRFDDIRKLMKWFFFGKKNTFVLHPLQVL